MARALPLDMSDLSVMLFHEGETKLKYYLSLLRSCGFREINTVETVGEAMKQVISGEFNLVLLNHVAEAVEASKLLEELKGLDVTAELPVVAITTDSSSKNQLRIFSKGVDGVVVAPFSRQVMEDMVRKLVHGRARSPSLGRLARAGELLDEGKLDDAYDAFMEVYKGKDYQLEALVGLFEVCCGKELWDEAEQNLRRALDAGKAREGKIESLIGLSRVMFHYGEFYEMRRQADKAVKSYRTSLQLNPFNSDSTMALLRLLQKQDEVEEILKLVRECAANFLPYSAQMGEVAACTADVGRQFLALKMPVQARRVFEEMFHLRHDNVDVYMELSDYFMEQGHVSRILKLLLEVSKKVKDADLMFKIGQILLDVQGTHMSAGKVNRTSGMDLSFFEKYDAPTVLNLAHKVFQQGLLLEPDNTKCWLNIVRCHLRRSQRQEAEEALNRVLQRAPNNPKVLEKAIEVTLDEQAYDFAASWLKHALKQFPKELAFFRLSARYHQEQGRTYDAIGYLKRALALDSRNGELFIELGELYEEAGEYSDAMVYLENAGRLLPDDPRVQQGIKRVLNSKYGND